MFSLSGYLNALDPAWKAAIVSDAAGNWQAVMPFVTHQKWRYTLIAQPAFTQHWGPCFAPTKTGSTYTHYSHKRKALLLLAEVWQQAHLVVQNCSPVFDYPLPFYEQGYALHTRYTFQLDLRTEPELLWRQVEPNLRRRIRQVKAQGPLMAPLTDPSQLLGLYQAQKEAGHDILALAADGPAQLQRLIHYLESTERGQTFGLWQSEQLLAAATFGRFRGKTLYLWGTYHPEAPGGAMAWLMWQQILAAKEQGSAVFDFEGSMNPGIARFFRRFGARPIPYLQLRKNALPLLIRWIPKFR